MSFPINQNNYHYFLPLNPLLSYAICAVSALKISLIFSKQIHFLNLDQQQARKVKKALFVVLQLSAAVSSTFFPTTSAILFVAACVTSIALSRSLTKPATSRKPALSFTEDRFLSKSHLPQDMMNKIISHIGENEDPVSRFKALANLAQSNRMFYMAVQKERAKIINEHPEIPTFEFFDSFAALIAFAKTHGVHKLNFENGALSDREIDTLVNQLPNLSYLDLKHFEISSTEMQKLALLKNLTYLNLGNSGIDDASIGMLVSHLSKLTHLDISLNTAMSSEGIKTIKALENLTHLEMASCKCVDDSCLQAIIPRLKKLTHLDISFNCTITSEGIKTIRTLESLTHLEMTFCKGVDDSSLQVLAMHLKKLAHLSIFDCTNVSSAGISTLSLLENLTSLSISHCNGVDDSVLEIITQHLKKLEDLCIVRCQNLNSTGIKHLKALENLKSLNICNCSGLDDSALQVISTYLKKLTYLNINSCSNVNTNGIKALASLTNLIDLSISYCNGVDDSSLQTLTQHLKKLTYLNVSNCKNISPIGIKSLIALKNLVYLYINQCDGVNNSSLQTLAQHLKKLRTLETYECKNITWVGKKYISTFYRKIQHRY